MEHKLFTDLKNSKNKIIWILERFEICRDDDNKLYANFIAFELGNGNKELGLDVLKKMSAYEFISNLALHKFINFESMRRARQLIQADEKYKHLRGTKVDSKSFGDAYFKNNIHNA
jgi:hypothetical protein